MEAKGSSGRRVRATLGLGLGVLLSLAVMIPALSQFAPEQPKDPGREMALAAGCDLTQEEVAMSVTQFENWTGERPATLEEAVLGVAEFLADDGAVFSTADLEAAADAATGTNPYEVKLPGVSIGVQRMPDGSYAVTDVLQCA